MFAHLHQDLGPEEEGVEVIRSHMASDIVALTEAHADRSKQAAAGEKDNPSHNLQARIFGHGEENSNPAVVADSVAKDLNGISNFVARVGGLQDQIQRNKGSSKSNEKLLDVEGSRLVHSKGHTIRMNGSSACQEFESIKNSTIHGCGEGLMLRNLVFFRILVRSSLLGKQVNAGHQKDQEEDKGKSEYNRSGLNGLESLRTTSRQDGGSHGSFGDSPEGTLDPMVMKASVSGQVINNQRTRIGGGGKVDSKSEDKDHVQEL